MADAFLPSPTWYLMFGPHAKKWQSGIAPGQNSVVRACTCDLLLQPAEGACFALVMKARYEDLGYAKKRIGDILLTYGLAVCSFDYPVEYLS